MCTPNMLTPSPNPDTDVLLPPPNSFTLTPTPHHLGLGATLTRQHARQSSTPSDMEQDTPPGLSPSDGPTTHVPSSVSSRLYPGLAVPVLSRVSSGEVGSDKIDRSWGREGSWRQTATPLPMTHSSGYNVPTHSTLKSYHNVKESAIEPSPTVHKDPTSILKSVLRDGKLTSTSSRDDRGGGSRSRERSSPPRPVLVKARSVSPKKATAPAEASVPYHKKAFNTHSRSKSSSSLKPERAYEQLARSRDDMSYTRSLSAGSTLHDLLSRIQVSPSHTEMCLTHVPAKKNEKPIVPRGKNGDRLFTSRSLERPSSPRLDRSLSPSRRVVSLPMSRVRSRERSPSPDRSYLRKSIEQLRDSISMSSSTFNDIDTELGNIPRTLTHEEEINLIISGDANFLRMSTPESFPSVDVQSNESIVSNESEYEMRF